MTKEAKMGFEASSDAGRVAKALNCDNLQSPNECV